MSQAQQQNKEKTINMAHDMHPASIIDFNQFNLQLLGNIGSFKGYSFTIFILVKIFVYLQSSVTLPKTFLIHFYPSHKNISIAIKS